MPTAPNGKSVDYGWSSLDPPDSCAYLEPEIFALVRHLQPQRILDVGCGNGALMDVLLRSGFDVAGVEPDERGVALARARCPGARLYQLSVDDDPTVIFEDGRSGFDLVISTEVIEHLLYPRRLLRFAHQVLGSGGHLIVSTPYHGYVKNLALSVFNKFDDHHHPLRDGGHVKFFSPTTIRRLMNEEGFRTQRISGVGRLPLLWKSMVILASRD